MTDILSLVASIGRGGVKEFGARICVGASRGGPFGAVRVLKSERVQKFTVLEQKKHCTFRGKYGKIRETSEKRSELCRVSVQRAGKGGENPPQQPLP